MEQGDVLMGEIGVVNSAGQVKSSTTEGDGAALNNLTHQQQEDHLLKSRRVDSGGWGRRKPKSDEEDPVKAASCFECNTTVAHDDHDRLRSSLPLDSRVVAPFQVNGRKCYYIGTIKEVTERGVQVLFDDGDDLFYEWEEAVHDLKPDEGDKMVGVHRDGGKIAKVYRRVEQRCGKAGSSLVGVSGSLHQQNAEVVIHANS
jgi:hypothetical protein